jgi:hypothetical protein
VCPTRESGHADDGTPYVGIELLELSARPVSKASTRSLRTKTFIRHSLWPPLARRQNPFPGRWPPMLLLDRGPPRSKGRRGHRDRAKVGAEMPLATALVTKLLSCKRQIRYARPGKAPNTSH